MQINKQTAQPEEKSPGPPLYMHFLLLGLIFIVGAIFLLKIYRDTAQQKAQSFEHTAQETDGFSVEHVEQTPQKEVVLTTGTPGALENLQIQLTHRLEELAQLHGGSWSIYVENLTTDAICTVHNSPHFAGPLCSLFTMGAVYESFETLSKDMGGEALKASVDQMLADSTSPAAQELLLALGRQNLTTGIEKVNQFCEKYHFDDTIMTTASSRDKTGQNVTSPSDCGKFLALLCQATEDLPYADVMLYHLKKISPAGPLVSGIPEDGSKTANLATKKEDQIQDALLVYDTPRNDYVLCLMAEDITDSKELFEDVAELSNQIYGYFNQ